MNINIKYWCKITINGVEKNNSSTDYKSKQLSTLYSTNPQQVHISHTLRR